MNFKRRIVKFGSDNLANELSGLSSEEIDDLTFGAIRVDGKGDILHYNAAEGDIAGREPKDMIGRNFFSDVAPCTNTEEFEGRFKEGVEQGGLNTTILYTFDYEMEPTQVRVRMQEAADDGVYWILVKRV